MPITAADEWMCHQFVSTFDHVANSDSQWTERVWLSAFSKDGAFQVNYGLGKYTNRNVMDASIGIVLGDREQINIRASRMLFPQPDNYEVGPMRYDIVEPLRRVRVVLDDNDQNVRADLTFIGTTEPYEQTPQMFRRRRGRLVNHMLRYFQTGSVEGWLEVDGVRHEVRAEDWWASRDRSWGLRANTGEFVSSKGECRNLLGGFEPGGEGIPFLWSFFSLEFPTWSASFEFAQTPDNKRLGPALGHVVFAKEDGSKESAKILDVDHEWTFVPGTEQLSAIRSTFKMAGRPDMTVEMDVLTIGYLRAGGGGYGGYKEWSGGLWLGPMWIDTDRLDLTDQALRDELHFSDAHALRVRCGDEEGWGTSQPRIPAVGELLTT